MQKNKIQNKIFLITNSTLKLNRKAALYRFHQGGLVSVF